MGAAVQEHGYVLDVGPYRYAVTHGERSVRVQCRHLISGVVAEAEAVLQNDARMAARNRVDEIREGRA